MLGQQIEINLGNKDGITGFAFVKDQLIYANQKKNLNFYNLGEKRVKKSLKVDQKITLIYTSNVGNNPRIYTSGKSNYLYIYSFLSKSLLKKVQLEKSPIMLLQDSEKKLVLIGFEQKIKFMNFSTFSIFLNYAKFSKSESQLGNLKILNNEKIAVAVSNSTSEILVIELTEKK